jgi:hypothetical protein
VLFQDERNAAAAARSTAATAQELPMTVHDERDTARTPTVPVQRIADDASAFPWPEPWRHSRVAHPRSEFWDVETASWRSRGPIPPQRSRV